MPDTPIPRWTTFEDSPVVFLAPMFQQARLSDLLGEGPGAGFLQLTGGTMSGPIIYPGIPQAPLELVNKRYVDLLAGGYQDAPNDGGYYGRWFGQWQPVLALSGGIMTGRMILAEDAVDLLSPVTLRQIAPLLGDFVNRAGDTMTGPLVLDADPATDMEAATKQYVDNATPIGAPFLPLAGGTMLGPLMLFRNPLLPMEAATALYVDTALGSYVALSGGPGAIMTGLLTLSGNPQTDSHAANKFYVDQQIAAQALYQGTWQVQLNNPDLSNLVPPPLHGYSWIAVTVPPDTPVTCPPGMPGLSGTPINNGDTVIWNDLLTVWERVVGSGLTRLQADALYVNLSGDTMVGGGLRIIQSGTPNLTLSSTGATTAADLLFGAGNTARWTLRKEATVQGDLSLLAWNAAGTVASEVMHWNRTTSDVTLTGGNYVLGSDGTGVVFASGQLYKAFGANQPLVVRLPLGNPMLRVEDSNGLNRRRLLDEFIGVLKAGDTMQGPLFAFREPVEDMEVATKLYVDSAAPGVGTYVQITGDTMTGPLVLPNGQIAVPSLQFGAGGDTGFSRTGPSLEISVQGQGVAMFSNTLTLLQTILNMSGNRITNLADALGASDALNQRVGDARYAPIAIAQNAPFLPLDGGTMSGDIFLAFAPTQDMHASTKLYVDTAVATGSTYQGQWQVALNVPDLSTIQALPGWRYLCRTNDPAVGETPPINIPGLTGRTIYDGDFVLWDAPLNQWDLLHAGGLTKTEADTLYVSLAGSTMTGLLTLAGDPVGNLDAATRQFVLANAGGGPGGGIPEPPPGSPPQGRTTSAGGGTSSWLPVLPLTGGQLSGALNIYGGDALQLDLLGGATSAARWFSQSGGSFSWINRANNIFALSFTSSGVPTTTDRLVVDVGAGSSVFTGTVSAGAPTADGHLTTKAYVDGLVGTGVADYLPLTGGTLTGPLFLPAGPPPQLLAAATKQYVDNLVATVVGIAVFVGSMDASTGLCVFTALSGIPNGQLPPANSVPTGSHLIVTISGTPPPPSPVAGIPFDSGDWVISDGAAWSRLAFGGTNVVAAGVAVVPSVFGAFNVQTSLQNAEATLLRKVSPDPLSFLVTGGVHPLISWPGTNPVGPPTITTGRSLGARLVLYSGTNGADFALGIEGSTLWYQAGSATNNHRWYGGATQYANLNNGGLTVNTGGLTVNNGNIYTSGGFLEARRPIANDSGTAPGSIGLRISKPDSNANSNAGSVQWTDNSGRNIADIRGRQVGVNQYYTIYGILEGYMNQQGYSRYRVFHTTGGDWNVGYDVRCRTLYQSSDERQKTDIAPVDPDEVDAVFAELDPVRFKWKAKEVANPLAVEGVSKQLHRDPGRLHWGFIAQNVERASPHLASTMPADDVDPETMSYDLGGVVALLVAKVKQLEARLNGMG